MSRAPSPDEIYDRAEQEGRRRLALSGLDQVATGFIAGVTIVFGIVALGVVTALVQPQLGNDLGKLAGALSISFWIAVIVCGRMIGFTLYALPF